MGSDFFFYEKNNFIYFFDATANPNTPFIENDKLLVVLPSKKIARSKEH